MNSIRRFLLIVLLAAITLFNFLAALQGYQRSMVESEKLFDQQLVDIADLLGELNIGKQVNGLFQEEFARKPAQVIAEQKNLAFQVWYQDQLIQHSANAPLNKITETEQGFSYATFNGYRWRAYSVNYPEQSINILVAERNDLRFVLAESVILQAVLPVVFGLPLIGLLIWLIVGSGLKPLRQLALELIRKKPEDLSTLSTENLPKELQQLVQSTNNLLMRLDASFKREKRLTSDAAHELRTPLSVLKIQLHNLAAELPADNQTLKKLNSSVETMSHLIEQILDLYRTTPDQFSGSFSNIDLAELTKSVIGDIYPRIDSKDQLIEFQGSEHSNIILGDEFSLRLLLKNLIDNASKYTPEGGSINVLLQNQAGKICLIVEDSGPGITQELYERVFERFYRVGGDQHQSNQVGCGLGLAIVKHIVELHGAEIALARSSRLGGLAVQISFAVSDEVNNKAVNQTQEQASKQDQDLL